MCGEVSGLRDWIIVQPRHAKSFSRFLLDREEAILITLQTGVDLPVVTAHSLQPRAHSPQLTAQAEARPTLSAGNEERDEPLDYAG